MPGETSSIRCVKTLPGDVIALARTSERAFHTELRHLHRRRKCK